MARGRMINKVISLDEKVNALSNDSVRLLFTWLIPHLDCEGRMYGDPQTVKSIVFPQRSMDVRTMQKYLDELVESGLIQRYVNGGTTCICFPNFKKHQVGLNKSKENPSQIPPPPQRKVDVSAMLQQQGADVDSMVQLNGTTRLELNVGTTLAQQDIPSQIPAPGAENLRNNSGNNPPQVKVETKVKDKVEVKDTPLNPPISQSLSTEEVITAYQENILLGGTVSEEMEYELKTACGRYSPSWVKDAIKEALAQNQPFWRYIVGILKNWSKDGKPK